MEKAEGAELAYTVESSRGFDELVEGVQEKIVENGFRVLFVHDVQKTMQDKGYAFAGYKIIELCNAKLAYQILSADMNIGLMMPCKINVYEKGDKRIVAGVNPVLISKFFPDAEQGSASREVERVVKKIIDEVK